MLISSDSQTRCWALLLAFTCEAASAETPTNRPPVLCEIVAEAIASTVDGRRAGLTLQENLALASTASDERDGIAAFVASEITEYYSDTTVMPTDEMHDQQKALLHDRSMIRCYREFGTD